jgi:hypothetical protein
MTPTVNQLVLATIITRNPNRFLLPSIYTPVNPQIVATQSIP